MSYKEVLNKGLKREYEFTVSSSEFDSKVKLKVEEIKKTIKVDGFRPGKVPNNIVMQKHGDAITNEVLNALINENVSKIIRENKHRPVSQPKVDYKDKDQKESDTDKVYKIEYEVFPEIKLTDFSKIEIESISVKLDEKEIDKRIDLIAKSQRSYKEQKKDYRAKKEDSVLLDYEGTIDGKNFDGGKAENQTIVIGSERFIKELEDGLIGVKAGDKKKINVKFPNDYSSKDLQNAKAVFECNIKKISSPVESKVNDELAKSMGATDLKDLKDKVKNQMQTEYKDLTKNLDKKALFEKLQSSHKFDLPEDLINSELQNLKLNYLNAQSPVSTDHEKEIKDKKLSTENEVKFKDDAKNRIELGLILQEIGQINKITVSPEEMNKALFEYAGNFKGQEQKVIDYYRNNQEAAMQLQAPLYENKIVDFILTKVKLKEKEIDVDSFIKIYNNVNSVETKNMKKKVVKKKTVKKKSKKQS